MYWITQDNEALLAFAKQQRAAGLREAASHAFDTFEALTTDRCVETKQQSMAQEMIAMEFGSWCEQRAKELS